MSCCKDNKGFNTKAIHAGNKPDPVVGAHATPIYQTSTFVFKDVDQGARRFAGEEDGYIYTRLGNPTETELEDKMAVLENGEAAAALSSGMAAISATLLALLQKGDHIVASKCLYGCTFDLINTMLPKFGVEVSLIDTTNIDEIKSAIKSNTKVLYFETPGNPTLGITDIAAAAKIAHEHGIKVVVDNTFMSPYLQRPLELGADVVVHSATKYIGGHGDVVAGIIVGKKDFIGTVKMTTLKNIGGVISPFDAYLLIRGLKTLGIRMDRHCSNAMKVAEFLEKHPAVDKVHYPGLESFSQHELAKKQMHGFGGMICFELKGGLEAGKTLMNNLNVITLAVSLGCVDSLIEHPASMTHSGVPHEERLKAGITDGLVRLSVGIEDADDIISDLGQALDKIK